MINHALIIVLVVGLAGCSDSDRDAGVPADTLVTLNDAHIDTGSTREQGPSLVARPELPEGYTLRAEATGDLDGDDRPERVIVADTDRTGDLGRERKILVYRRSDDAWELWTTASGPVLPSEAGGTMGDPFALIEIDRGAIVIDHYGGSSIRWAHTDRFRYQDGAFHLIGATAGVGRPCVEWTEIDYNLSTGSLRYTTGRDTCEDVEEEIDEEVPPKNTIEISRKRTMIPTMDGFVPGDNQVALPGGVTGHF